MSTYEWSTVEAGQGYTLSVRRLNLAPHLWGTPPKPRKGRDEHFDGDQMPRYWWAVRVVSPHGEIVAEGEALGDKDDAYSVGRGMHAQVLRSGAVRP